MEVCSIASPGIYAGVEWRVQTEKLQPTDAALVARVRAGDADSFRLIVHRYQDRIYSLARNYLANEEDALDATQEAFIKAYRQLSGFGGRSDVYTWLYRIAVNTCIDHLRRARSRPQLQETETGLDLHAGDGGDPQRELERAELRRRLLAALGALSPKLRMTAILHDVEGYTLEEAARAMRCTLGTAKSRLWRARDELRRSLRSDDA